MKEGKGDNIRVLFIVGPYIRRYKRYLSISVCLRKRDMERDTGKVVCQYISHQANVNLFTEVQLSITRVNKKSNRCDTGSTYMTLRKMVKNYPKTNKTDTFRRDISHKWSSL